MMQLIRRPSMIWTRYRVAFVMGSAILLTACGSAPSGSGKLAGANGSDRALRTKLDGWGPSRPPAGFPRFVDHSVGQEEISMQAMGLVGVPYRWGGNTPAAGFDCSGLVRYVVERAADVNLPRTTGEMSHQGVSIAPDEVAPGDLIFFNTTGRAHSHVGVYVGDYRFVNAPSTGGTVRIDYVTNPYWAKRFDGIRRIAGQSITPPTRAPIQDTPTQPMAPAPSIMPPRAYASESAPIATPATPAPSVPVVAVTSNVPAPALTPAPAPVTMSSDPIAATIAKANGETDDPIARIATKGY